MNWYFHALKNYANFSGRARRSEYWTYNVISWVVCIALLLVDLAIGGRVNLLSGLYGILVFVPSVAVFVRRLHDSGRSAWSALFLLIPFLGAAIGLVFMFLDSEPGENRYGPSPK
jgi:uncharacterized membrane protein YhaH (DUF805 family)